MSTHARWRRLAAITAAVAFAIAPAVCRATAADSASGFVASRGASAEEQLREQLLARVRTGPRTGTQYLMAGYVQLDGISSRRRQDGDEQNTLLVTTTPFDPADRDYRLSLRQTRFNWLSRTGAGSGALWARLDANLFPVDGTTALTVNQAFVRWDEHVIAGKAFSTFMDDATLPTTLDYVGPGSVTYAAQLLLRVGVAVGEAWRLEASVEDPQSGANAVEPGLELSSTADRPDLAARVRYEGERGHLQLAGVSRALSVRAIGAGGAVEREFESAGVLLSGALSLGEDDELLAQVVSGDGIARYINDPIRVLGVALETGGRLALVRITGATAYAQHQWAPTWMSVAGVGTTWCADDAGSAPEALRRTVYASASLVHQLRPRLFVGAEALWGEATRVNGARASNSRVQVSGRWLVF